MNAAQQAPSRLGVLRSVNVGMPREVEWSGRRVLTAIWKEPTEQRLLVVPDNLAGDAQADLRVHGVPDKAVYAYAFEDYRWWSERLGTELEPGTFGENLTTEGLAHEEALIGDVWEVGSAVLQVAQTRQPCFKLGIRMGDARFVQEFDEARRFGLYLRILEAGELGVGDEIVLRSRPDHTMTSAVFADALDSHDPEAIGRLLEVEAVPEGIKAWAVRQLGRLGPA